MCRSNNYSWEWIRAHDVKLQSSSLRDLIFKTLHNLTPFLVPSPSKWEPIYCPINMQCIFLLPSCWSGSTHPCNTLPISPDEWEVECLWNLSSWASTSQPILHFCRNCQKGVLVGWINYIKAQLSSKYYISLLGLISWWGLDFGPHSLYPSARGLLHHTNCTMGYGSPIQSIISGPIWLTRLVRRIYFFSSNFFSSYWNPIQAL